MGAERRIQNDEQLERSENWLTQKLLELEDPLLSETEKQKLLRKIDFVAQEIQRYKFGGVPETKKAEPPKSQEKPTQKVSSALANWLDDD